MKKMTKFYAISIILLGLAAGAFAQATATATATIVTPIAIAKNTDINFGNLSVNTSSGTLVLATDNSRSFTGGVTLMPGGTISAAQFTVTGLSGAIYTFSLPASVTLTDPSSNTMLVNTFSDTSTGTLSGGSVVVLVGATLNVNASQPAGVYTNTTDLTATVNYN